MNNSKHLLLCWKSWCCTCGAWKICQLLERHISLWKQILNFWINVNSWFCYYVAVWELDSGQEYVSCAHTRMHVCTQARMQACTHARVLVCDQTRMRACTHAHMYACTYVRVHACTHARSHAFKHAHMFDACMMQTYTLRHACTHACMHAGLPARMHA